LGERTINFILHCRARLLQRYSRGNTAIENKSRFEIIVVLVRVSLHIIHGIVLCDTTVAHHLLWSDDCCAKSEH